MKGGDYMVRLDEIANDKFFKSLEQQQKFIEELYAPSRAMQAQLKMATSSYFHFVQQASSVYVPALQASQLIKASMIPMHKAIFPSVSPMDCAPWRELMAFQKSLQDLNATLPTQSIIEILDMDALDITEPSILDLNTDETLTDIESTTIEALSKDKKFITWFRLTFPDFANQPVQVIAKYFFHQILAPLIVQLLMLLINGSFKDE